MVRIKTILAILGTALIIIIVGASSPVIKEASFDLDHDGINETLHLENGIARLYKNSEEIFTSDPAWDVKEIIPGDFNNDGQNDFGLSLWKEGNYGEATPFWDNNDDSYKMHLFLYTWERGRVRALWHSSNLPKINVLTLLQDLEGDGKNTLTVLERDYSASTSPFSVAHWRWNNWGFELHERVEITSQ